MKRYTPERIVKLQPNEIFVFGSNTEGRHGRGAAKMAMKFGAIYGQASGRQGQTYAIITKDLRKGKRSIPLDRISKYIDKFIIYANNNPDLIFLVTKIGSSLAGYSIKEMRNIFIDKIIPSNIILPIEYTIPKSII